MITVAVAVIVPAVAVIVYVADGDVAVGVPEITPVVVFKDKPAGNVGLTLYVGTSGKPVAMSVGVGVIAVLIVAVIGSRTDGVTVPPSKIFSAFPVPSTK
jgi:hypothetical protein